ncbi:restriction endonuclease subunit S [Vibrio vulnificus]|uniref:restriction endonuclease subunit S n=1 Tax=Vibrio vulnificus TaxID=672 RepID=UPI00405885F3
MVPNGWSKKKLTSLCDKIAVGLAISVTPYMANSGVKLIRNQNIKRNYFNTKSVVYITDEFAAKNNSKRVYAGDVVAVRTGSNIGEACVVPAEFDGALTFTTLIARPNIDKLNSDYLSTHMNSEYGVSEVQRLMAGGGKPNLNSGELKNYTLLTPPLPEQRKIAQILSTWDRGIATTEKLIDASKQQKKALMQQLLTGKKRLVDPETGKAFEGEWEETTISSFLKESKVKSLRDDAEKRLTVRLHLKGVEKRTIRGTESIDSTAHFSRSSGQFIYGKQNIHKGAFGIIPESLHGYESSQDIPCFDFKDACIPMWFMHYLSQESIYKSLEHKMSGTGSKRLNPKMFFKVKLPLITLREQQKIASVLTAADKEIELLEAKLAHFKQEKKALMQQLLTGKRRVRVAETEAA